ncbi:hypothetical protein CBL_00562 [Carabus blaptoides fortunei]
MLTTKIDINVIIITTYLEKPKSEIQDIINPIWRKILGRRMFSLINSLNQLNRYDTNIKSQVFDHRSRHTYKVSELVLVVSLFDSHTWCWTVAATDVHDDDATSSSHGAPSTLRLYRRGRLPWDGLLLISRTPQHPLRID